MSFANRPNLLFIMTDHQRADSLGMVQSGIEVAPNLNQLAGSGTVFTRAYTTCPLCVPARTALATVKYPTQNGVVYNDWQGVRAGDHCPLHQILDKVEYAVGHIGVDHIRLSPPLRDRVTFATWIDNRDYELALADWGIKRSAIDLSPFQRAVAENQEGRQVPVRYTNTASAVWPYPAEYFKDAYCCQQAVNFINQPRNQPFALFLYLWAPHPPLQIPEPYASRFDPALLDMPSNVGVPADVEPPGRRHGIAAQLAEGVPEGTWRKVWAAHLGLVHLADAGIGQVLAALAAAGYGEKTIVCFTVDHGDHLGQHAMYQKMEMYEPVIRIPLVIAGPAIHAQTVRMPISHLDILPTLLTLLELPIPRDVDGHDLSATLTTGINPPADRPVFTQYSGNPTIGDIRRTVITQRYKAVFDPTDRAELYALENDPLEMHNQAGVAAYHPILADLLELCRAWGRDHNDWVEL